MQTPVASVDGGEVFIVAIFVLPVAALGILLGRKFGRALWRFLIYTVPTPPESSPSTPVPERPQVRARVGRAIGIETCVAIAFVVEILAAGWPRWLIPGIGGLWAASVLLHMGLLAGRR
jgi:hypothetical protein